jgi:hypothetical protein
VHWVVKNPTGRDGDSSVCSGLLRDSVVKDGALECAMGC